MNELGKMISELRREKGFAQKELAYHLCVTDSTISNYENGKHHPDPRTLSQIADFFEVSVDYLLGRTTYRYSMDTLNKQLSGDYMVSDMLNTTLQLTPRNLDTLLDVLDLISKRNNQDLKNNSK